MGPREIIEETIRTMEKAETAPDTKNTILLYYAAMTTLSEASDRHHDGNDNISLEEAYPFVLIAKCETGISVAFSAIGEFEKALIAGERGANTLEYYVFQGGWVYAEDMVDAKLQHISCLAELKRTESVNSESMKLSSMINIQFMATGDSRFKNLQHYFDQEVAKLKRYN